MQFDDGSGAAEIPGFLSFAEVKEFYALYRDISWIPATIYDENNEAVRDDWRKAQTSNILKEKFLDKIKKRANFWFKTLNYEYYNFDISDNWMSEEEGLVLCKYEPGDYFNWHRDWDWAYNDPKKNPNTKKKLSCVIQFSDETDYTGGDLEIFGGSRVYAAPKGQGSAIIFPGFQFHRVTEVKTGLRITGLIFCHGDEHLK